jgi:hypothetical protein
MTAIATTVPQLGNLLFTNESHGGFEAAGSSTFTRSGERRVRVRGGGGVV